MIYHHKIIISFLLIFSLFYQKKILGQIDNVDTISTSKLLVLSGVSAGAFVYAYGIENSMWWKGEKSSFHSNWTNDWNASLGADKIGHFYFGYLLSNLYNLGFQWVGYKKNKSLLYSGIISFSYQTFLEIRDGFSKKYGFSWGDFGANFLGSFFPYLKNKYPLFSAVSFKISYDASERFKKNSNEYIIDDYESTYHWITFDINKIFPVSNKIGFPDFLDLSIGHSVKGLNFGEKRKHEFFIGLDWDWDSIPTNIPIISDLLKIINLYHLPAPTIKIYPNIVWYGLKL